RRPGLRGRGGGVTRSRGAAEVCRPAQRSSWGRTFLARINVHDPLWLFPVGSLLIPPRRRPGEARFTPRTPTRPARTTASLRLPAHAAQSPQRELPGSPTPPRLRVFYEKACCVKGPTWWPQPTSGRHAPRTTLLFALSEGAQIMGAPVQAGVRSSDAANS